MTNTSRARLPTTLRAGLVAAGMCWILTGSAVMAAPESRPEALRDLGAADSEARAAAISWLARDGLMEDLPALAEVLRDEQPEVRDLAESALVQIWSRSGDAEVDARLQAGIRQMNAGLLAQAIDSFTRIIELRPDFAEGWNKRATAYYLMGEYELSLRDCDEVMQRNPLHFGALSGYGMIYLKLDQLERALEYFERALDVHPNLGGAQAGADILRHRLGRLGKQSI